MERLYAVIPAAGMGTRLCPLTYAIPKEMLPLGPRPTIQLVVEELMAAGVKDFVIVIGNNKQAIPEHFTALGRENPIFNGTASFRYAYQPQPRGLGDAVLCAEGLVEGDFVVALGDAVISGNEDGGLVSRLLRVHKQVNSSATVAVQKVAPEATSRYGIIDPAEAGPEGSLRLADLVEKPGPDKAPSNLAICARYVLNTDVFDVLKTLEPGHGGEIQLTDALRTMAAQGRSYAVPLLEDEERWDVGNPVSYGKASVKAWLSDPVYGEAINDSLR